MKKQLICSILIFVLTMCACTSVENETTPTEQASADTKLDIVATVSRDKGPSWISAEEISEGFPVDIQFNNLSDISIKIDGTTVSLADAFQQELITPEELFAYAQIDARKGNCKRESTSINGLTYHIFTYPSFDLAIVYDILEAPDGQQHLIHTIHFDMANNYRLNRISILYVDDTTGETLDREDWGLTFEAVDVTDSGITFSCTQSGGQQIGQLQVYEYILCSTDSEGIGPSSGTLSPLEIQMEGTCTLSIDWTEAVGALHPGNYLLRLYVKDIYNQTQVHPLMKNYYDNQTYDIEFTVS